MKHHLEGLIAQALEQLREGGVPLPDPLPAIEIERTRAKEHGDFACNVALTLARTARLKPRELAARLVAVIPTSEKVSRTEVAGPGFINFYLRDDAFLDTISTVLMQSVAYGRSTVGANRRVQVEFVSANPTGPLHVGHGRGAAYGASLANLLDAVGFRVHREFYVNDAGRQMDILAVSVWLRYLEARGSAVAFPADGYRGDYVRDIAGSLLAKHADRFDRPANLSVTTDDPDKALDQLIDNTKTTLGADWNELHRFALEAMLADQRDDLAAFRVAFDEWFSEQSLYKNRAVEKAIAILRERGHLYEKDGAVWFRSTAFGDEKDRVVTRENGQHTYFASDIAYHLNKFERGFDHVIDIWGADHHGYIPRVKGALKALGLDPAKLEIALVQFAVLYRGGVKVAMGKRSGDFVTLRELREEVGNDAARFFYVLRKSEQHMDFDLDLAKSESADNPVYYVQYAHARVCSVFKQMREKGLTHDRDNGARHLRLLAEAHEKGLVARLAAYPEVLETAALAHEPHQLAHFLRELAYDFHTYYNTHTFLVEEKNLRDARLNLIEAARIVIANALTLLGVSAPESM
ncbi:MAG: arginine--tRNA ligase [Sulfurifustis sp.]